MHLVKDRKLLLHMNFIIRNDFTVYGYQEKGLSGESSGLHPTL